LAIPFKYTATRSFFWRIVLSRLGDEPFRYKAPPAAPGSVAALENRVQCVRKGEALFRFNAEPKWPQFPATTQFIKWGAPLSK
jgi:hypothetical protein